MANHELQEGLEVMTGVVNLSPAGHIVPFTSIPGHEAERLHHAGWQKAFFQGSYEEGSRDFQAVLTLGSKTLSDLVPEEIKEQAAQEIDGGTSTRSSVLLARIEERDGDISFTLCAAGDSHDAYWMEQPSQLSGNVLLDRTSLPDSPTRDIAIRDLHGALADAGAVLLGGALQEHYRTPAG